MTPLNCDKASFLLERRWDKALSPEEERALDSHLTVCETCREEAAAIELADAAFADLPTLEPCRDIAAAVATARATRPSRLRLPIRPSLLPTSLSHLPNRNPANRNRASRDPPGPKRMPPRPQSKRPWQWSRSLAVKSLVMKPAG